MSTLEEDINGLYSAIEQLGQVEMMTTMCSAVIKRLKVSKIYNRHVGETDRLAYNRSREDNPFSIPFGYMTTLGSVCDRLYQRMNYAIEVVPIYIAYVQRCAAKKIDPKSFIDEKFLEKLNSNTVGHYSIKLKTVDDYKTLIKLLRRALTEIMSCREKLSEAAKPQFEEVDSLLAENKHPSKKKKLF